MKKYFIGNNASDVWLKSFKAIKSVNSSGIVATRIGKCIEILHANYEILDPIQKWVSIRKPSINPAFALAEIVWILNGSNDSKFINFWNPILPKYAGKGKYYHGAYGYRIRKHFHFDQLENAYLAFKSNPNTRQVVIEIWDSCIDFPYKNGNAVSEDIPCNICSILKIRNDKLYWTQIIRSNDLFLGVPYNFVQFTSLQEILAGWLNINPGSYYQYSDSLHLYEKDLLKVSYDLKKKITNCDSLSIPKKKSDILFERIFERMQNIINSNLTKKKFVFNASLNSDEIAFNNILYLIGADAAFRKGWRDISEKLLNLCENKLYKKMWENWKKNKT